MATRRTKAVCRNLPPDLPESVFLDTLKAEGFTGRYGYVDYARGAWKQRAPVPSVAWIQLVDEAALFDFRGAFGGRIFRAGHLSADEKETKTNEGEPGDDDTEEDGAPAPSVISRGNNVPEGMEEWRARVEYAPYQKTPRGKTHRDKREGTIERDASYVKFVKDLEAQMEGPPVAPMSAEQALERREAAERASSGKGDFKVSALLKYVMDKKKKEMALRTATKAAKAAAKGGKRAGGKDAKQQREVGHGRRDKKGAKGGGKGGAKQPAPGNKPAPKPPAPNGRTQAKQQDGKEKKQPPEPKRQPPPEPKQVKVKAPKPQPKQRRGEAEGGGGSGHKPVPAPKGAKADGGGGNRGGGGRGGRGGGKPKPRPDVQVFRSNS